MLGLLAAGGIAVGTYLGAKSQGKSAERAADTQANAAREANAFQKMFCDHGAA